MFYFSLFFLSSFILFFHSFSPLSFSPLSFFFSSFFLSFFFSSCGCFYAEKTSYLFWKLLSESGSGEETPASCCWCGKRFIILSLVQMAEDKTEGEGPGEFDVEGSPPRFLECPSGEQKSSSSCIVEEIVPDKPSLQRGGCEQEENIPPTSLLCQPIIQGGKKKGLRKAKPHRDLLSPPRVAPSPPRKGGDKQIKGGKGEGGVRRGEGEQDRRREIGDLEALRVLAREFYVSVEDHFHSFEPGLCDDSQVLPFSFFSLSSKKEELFSLLTHY